MDKSRLTRLAMVLTILVAGLIVRAPSSSAVTWLDNNYKFRKTITVDHTKVSGGSDLTDYPMLVSFTDISLKTVANSGVVQNSNGYDIVFSDSTGGTKLDHEIEKYVPTTGEIDMWVRVPTLSASVDTVLYMYYDNSTVSTSQENKTGVWNSNYKGVWHFGEASGSAGDSTSNGTSGTATGTVTHGAVGAIGNAYSYPGTTNNFMSMGDPVDGHLDMGTGSFSFGAWVYQTATTGTWQVPVSKGGSVLSDAGWDMEIDNLPKTYSDVTDGAHIIVTPTYTPPTVGTWFYETVVLDRSAQRYRLYINGVEIGTAPNVVGVINVNTTHPLTIGAYDDGNEGLNGRVDEVEVQNAAPSAGWIATTYANQSSPSTFYVEGPGADVAQNTTTVTVIVDPTLSFVVSSGPATCNGVSTTTGATSSATAVGVGHVSSVANAVGSQYIAVGANATNGYTVYARYTGQMGNNAGAGPDYIADLSGATNASPTAFSAAGTAAFGYTTDDNTLGTGTAARFTTGGAKWAAMTTSNAEVMYEAVGPALGSGSDQHCIGYQVGVAAATHSSTYQTTVIYTVVANF